MSFREYVFVYIYSNKLIQYKMKTLKELNRGVERETLRMRLIELDRRLKQLNRTRPKNWIESLGMWLQEKGIKMQIKGIMIRMKNSNGNVHK